MHTLNINYRNFILQQNVVDELLEFHLVICSLLKVNGQSIDVLLTFVFFKIEFTTFYIRMYSYLHFSVFMLQLILDNLN